MRLRVQFSLVLTLCAIHTGTAGDQGMLGFFCVFFSFFFLFFFFSIFLKSNARRLESAVYFAAGSSSLRGVVSFPTTGLILMGGECVLLFLLIRLQSRAIYFYHFAINPNVVLKFITRCVHFF